MKIGAKPLLNTPITIGVDSITVNRLFGNIKIRMYLSIVVFGIKYVLFFNKLRLLMRRYLQLKQWKCVQVLDHNKIGEVIEENQRDGWRLNTYNTAIRFPFAFEVRHYLLFERDG